MDVLDGIDEWQLEIEAWLQLPIKFLEPMEEQSILFWHNNCEAEVLSVVFANSLRMIFLTLAIVAQIVMLGELPHLS